MCVIEYSASIISGETKAPIPREEKEIEAKQVTEGRGEEDRKGWEWGEEGGKERERKRGGVKERGKKEGWKGKEVEEGIVRDGGEDGGARRNKGRIR